jgi:hypothetical protein
VDFSFWPGRLKYNSPHVCVCVGVGCVSRGVCICVGVCWCVCVYGVGGGVCVCLDLCLCGTYIKIPMYL